MAERTVIQAIVKPKQKTRYDRLARLYCMVMGLPKAGTAEAIRHMFDNMDEKALATRLAKQTQPEEGQD